MRIDGAGIDAQRADGFPPGPNEPGRQESELSAVGPESGGGREGISWSLGSKGKPLPRPAQAGGPVNVRARPNPPGWRA